MALLTVGCCRRATSQSVQDTPLPVTEVPLGRAEVPHDDENLQADLKPWTARAPLRANDTLTLYEALMARHFLPAVFKLVLIYNNRIYWPNREDVNGTEPPRPASPFKLTFHRRLTYLMTTGRLTLPNVLFVFSSEDNRPRWCAPGRKCAVPLFSMTKTLGEPDGDDEDILIPQFNWAPSSLYLYPWHLKKDLAFFRGVPFCSGFWNNKTPNCSFVCPRAYFAWRSFEDQRSGRPRVLDVGLVEPYIMNNAGPKDLPLCTSKVPPVVPITPVSEHSQYKWLLHLEGITASSRLSQLFLTNSVVLFQQQPFVEYFYRSLKPNVHYVPFWMTTPAGIADVYDVVGRLRRLDRDEPAATQRIVREAQMFAAK
ncbi:Protein O-glucosyltransferase 1 [Tetrabaena socialis]|uniref:Protein O-glucosyltransferase 1 n=1 Tax=Tetrabaena socialis TaxID=47790 RepID=A0A2J8ACS8_9CHLO|nr:Protein O-glucosyltransferase 1 [Tetrabaena socialis]|eukprot:PNH10317.1 Protein O-glucosyltransferase 1 [Tetrabaena socialis]